MEISISRFVTDADAFEFSASIAERGENAGAETWANAEREGEASPLLTTAEQIGALRDYVKGFGVWDDEEIASWSDAKCNALFIQLISGDLRECGLADEFPDEFDWDAYQERAEQGQIRGNIYRGDDGEIYYSLSN